MSKGVQIALGATAIVLLLGWYARTNLEAGATSYYYQTLDEFRSASAEGKRVRVHGYVTPGSIERDVPAKSVRFGVQNAPPHVAGAEAGPLPVVFASLETPDLFKDGAEVVVEGELRAVRGDAVFHATNVMAKCPSKFEAKRTDPAPF